MPTYQVTDPQTGKTIRLTGDSPPTEQELEQIFSQYKGEAIEAEPIKQESTFAEDAIGVAENVAGIASGIVAEPLAGLAGIAQSINPFADKGAGAEAVENVRGALTYLPKTDRGQQQQQAIGEAIAPISEAISDTEKFLGEQTLRITGSPALAAMAHTLPTAALELIGVKGAGKIASVKEPTKSLVKKTIIESAPEVAQVKKASKALFDEVDKSGAVVKKEYLNKLNSSLDSIAKSEGIREGVSGQVYGAINAIKKDISRGQPIPINEINDLRTIARNAINPMDANVTRQAMLVMDEVDSFVDGIRASDLARTGTIKADDISKNLTNARKLWGRAKRAEMIGDAIEMGASRKAGVEKGIRNELNNLLNRKKSRKFLSNADVEAIRKVTDGDYKQNIASFLGGAGIKFENSPSIFNAMISGGGTAGVASSLGMTGAAIPVAAAVVTAGTAAKELAKKITVNRSSFLKSMQLAGNDAERITKAYLKAVPKSKRSAADLSELLLDPSIDLSTIETIANETVKDAVNAAKFKKEMLQASAALAAGANLEDDPDNNEN